MFGALQAMQQAARSSAPSSPTAPAPGIGGLSGLPPPPPEPPQPPSCLPGTDGRTLFVARFGAFGWPAVAFSAGTGQLAARQTTLDAACEAAIASGEAWFEWIALRITHPTDAAELIVHTMSDDLCVGEGFRVRLNMSALGFRSICRRWGWLFPTERICDAIDGQASVRLQTRTWNRGPWPAVNGSAAVPGSAMANPGTGSAMMLNQAAAHELARAGSAGVVSNAGKALVSALGARFRAGTNLQIYGWNTAQQAKPPNGPFEPNDPRWRASRVIQSAGTNDIHESWFVDYAQTARPVRRGAWIRRGAVVESVDLAAVYRSPQWSHLVRVGGGPLPIRLGEP